MFNEIEIAYLIEVKDIRDTTQQLKKDFIKKAAPYLEISDHDFLSLIMLSPALGIALADNKISFLEEVSLNKKARKLSKGSYFLTKDPVVFAMQFLIKNFAEWEDRFFQSVKVVLDSQINEDMVKACQSYEYNMEGYNFREEIMKSPYILIRFLSSFFMEDDDDIFNEKSMSSSEQKKLLEIGDKLGLMRFPVFQKFCKYFDLKTW
jgi:hypothetical protein